MRYQFIYLCVISHLTQCYFGSEEASFYGNSYISIPFKEARSSTDIYFKFRTRLQDALIFLVAGTTDFCIIKLENAQVKININLGAGEFELTSPVHPKLNDFQWHEVVIERREANLKMIVDKNYLTQKYLKGKFFELNIHYGLFVADHKYKNNSDIFFGHVDNFRGCLADLVYNGISVLEQARHRQNSAIVEGVTWNCANEFTSSTNESISFLHVDSYVTFNQRVNLYKSIDIKFEVMTTAKNSLLLYNFGYSLTNLEYFLLAINDHGRVSCLLNAGQASLNITAPLSITDNNWHNIHLVINPQRAELSVDKKTVTHFWGNDFSIKLSEQWYVGGLESSRRPRAKAKGCGLHCENSFIGCIKNLAIDEVNRGISDVKATKSILPHCNVCSFLQFCQKCTELDELTNSCFCEENQHCPANLTSDLAVKLEILSVTPLQVKENNRTNILSNNIKLILDYSEFKITDKDIMFSITRPPNYGIVCHDEFPGKINPRFSLNHILTQKVHYLHNGAEIKYDNIELLFDIVGIDVDNLPRYYKRKLFSLPVIVELQNDPPTLHFDNFTKLHVIEGTQKVITDELKAEDPDTLDVDIKFNVVDSNVGHFEYIFQPGRKITSFSQVDIENRQIIFVNNENNLRNSSVSFRLHDGISESQLYTIPIIKSHLYGHLSTNTGLVVLYGSSTIITSRNISFISKTLNLFEYRAKFLIVKGPTYGVIELKLPENNWESTSSFTNIDLNQERVRYRHIEGNPKCDFFNFQTALDKNIVHTFQVHFERCSIKPLGSKHIVLNATWEQPLTSHILYKAYPDRLQPLMFAILHPPVYGYLFLKPNNTKRLGTCDSFTQNDILNERLHFRLFQKGYSLINDTFSFVVFSSSCNNYTSNLSLQYLPPNDEPKINFNNKLINVEEGENVLIDIKHLNFSVEFDMIFNITRPTQNGYLYIQNSTKVIRNNTTYFTLQELRSLFVFYKHDDSETVSDQFTFMALGGGKNSFQFVDVFHINVTLKNDNSPVRSNNRIFEVVVGGEKLLSRNDLSYMDGDINTQPHQIEYICREITNGYFFNSRKPGVKVKNFSQDDINNNLIVFKHKGPEQGQVKFWVTDGEFHVNSLFEIKASAPFINIINPQKIIIEQGKSTIINAKHLSFSTNLFATYSEVVYTVRQPPKFGKLINNQLNNEISNFTHNDVYKNLISFKSEMTTFKMDKIELEVVCKEIKNVKQIPILIFPSVYWSRLSVISNRTLYVEESTSVLITNENLNVTQAGISPSEIIYHITKAPSHGYLTMLDKKYVNEPITIPYFTQEMINKEKIYFIQSEANQTKDYVVFNVTNSILWQNDLTLHIEIIPELFFVKTSNLVVPEGGTVNITTTNVFIESKFYKEKVMFYFIEKDVSHGCIQLYGKCTKTKRFSHLNLQDKIIQYAHDGSENLSDKFVIVAETDHKRSLPAMISIVVTPTNDHKPYVVNNTGLVMWEGGFAYITNTMLAATDNDFPRNVLNFQIQNCWYGSLFMEPDMSSTISSFSQDLIDKRLIVFRHQGGANARFKFNVTDGVHTTKELIFHIKVKPVHLKLYSRPLHIFPLQRQNITASHLLASISDPNRTIYYEITSAPTFGRLMMASSSKDDLKIVQKFTQNDVNNSRLFYEHTHPFNDLYINDSFRFSVKAYLAPTLNNKVLKIDISISSGDLDSYITIPRITVDEGGTTNIALNLSEVVFFLENHANLRSPIIHANANTPLHGQVYLENNINITTFTQLQLELGQVIYEHDHSDSLSDKIFFSVYLIPGFVPLCNITVPIFVNPINDQPFQLVTKSPNFFVVQGENHTITYTELTTIDLDTGPEMIKYVLITSPANGKLVLLPDLIQATYFTQLHINENRLLYVHNGLGLQDSFQFRVWDGKFRPEFTLFKIFVIPINLTINSGLPVNLQQGSDVAFLSEKQFQINTNADLYKIKYKIVQQPHHGMIYVKDNSIMSFTQIDLHEESVMYLQTDMTTANDSFKVVGEIFSENNTSSDEILVSIQVLPLMKINNFTVTTGGKNKVTLHILDASPLAKLTNSNPRFKITYIPQYAQFRKIIRSSGEKRNLLDSFVDSFTHQDIQSGLIYLFIKDIDKPWKVIKDKIIFSLRASIFQPAIGELYINLKHPHNDVYSTLAGPHDPEGHEGGLHLASPNITRDYLLIVSMITGVVILGVVVIIIIKCRSLEIEEINKGCDLQPTQLTKASDRLIQTIQSFPQTNKTNSDGCSTPLPTTVLPQCKVTPLSHSDLELRANYPYGVEEPLEEWNRSYVTESSYPNKNIMLRRNQYWV